MNIKNQEIRALLEDLNRNILQFDSRQIQAALAKIPLDVFGHLHVSRPVEYSNLNSWLPDMPSSEEQAIWTGSSDHPLMTVSLAFMKTVVSTHSELTAKSLNEGTMLDFGCGWGRMIRLFAKFIPSDQIYAVDPWERSIELCRRDNVHGNFYVSDFLPRDLPTPDGMKFDFILAFSVFTHLSEKATKLCINTLRDNLADDGVIAITIRPSEYWKFRHQNDPQKIGQDKTAQLCNQHEAVGFAFDPHNREAIEGDITYGDTSMSLDYIRTNFEGLEIARIELNDVDHYQMIVFLTKSHDGE